MANERMIPSGETKSVVTTTILSGGVEVSRQYQVLSLIVNKEVNRIPSANIIILDGQASEQTFEVSNLPDFEPGKEIEIKVGYRADEETVFKGIVIKHGIKIRKDTAVLMIECKDVSVKMTVACKSKYSKDSKDSDVIAELIDTYGIENTVEPTSNTHQQIVQYNSTDWDFILCRCDVNGLLCIPSDGKISIAKPVFSGDAALTIQYGATIHDLDAEIDARLQYKAVKGSAWNYTDQELIDDTEAEEPEVPDAGNLSAATLADVIGEASFNLIHTGKIDTPELQSWVNAKLLKNRLAKIRGSVRTDGTAAVNPGQMIQLNGVGERFEGKLFVTGVRQQIENGNWETVFQFGINPEWFVQKYDVQQPLAGALLPAVQGLQIGVVTKLQDDPNGEDRIMVRMPVIHKADEGIWCRICTLDAGKERGSFFRPEIDDEVVIGFLNDDPRHAVVLGMCNSSKFPAPLTAADENHEKGFFTRSKMKLIFNDDKKSISIETPAGNKFIITEDEKKILIQDQNSNKILLNEDGITIESAKDINIKAGGDITAEAGGNMTLKAGAQAVLKGGSGADLSSGGTTNVKGSLVNIN